MRGPRGILKARPNCTGYKIYSISYGGKTKTVKAHVEVATAFIGSRPKGYQVAHENGDRMDARASNLSYKTRAQNEQDKLRHGTAMIGDRNHQCKLSDADLVVVRQRLERGDMQKQIAEDFGVSTTLICKIHRGRHRTARLPSLLRRLIP